MFLAWWRGSSKVRTYEHDGREGHPFELDGELVAGLELCGWFVWSLGADGADEALRPLRYAREVKELCSFRRGQLDVSCWSSICRLTILRRCAGEHAISVVVVIRTIAAIIVLKLALTGYLEFWWIVF